MRKNILRKIPAIVVMIGITVLSAMPGNDPFLNAFHFSDKIKHFIAYFALGMSLCFWTPSKKWLAKPIIHGIIVVFICIVFGIFDEYHQSFVPGRKGNDLGDLAANTIGGLVTPFLYFLIIRWRASKKG